MKFCAPLVFKVNKCTLFLNLVKKVTEPQHFFKVFQNEELLDGFCLRRTAYIIE